MTANFSSFEVQDTYNVNPAKISLLISFAKAVRFVDVSFYYCLVYPYTRRHIRALSRKMVKSIKRYISSCPMYQFNLCIMYNYSTVVYYVSFYRLISRESVILERDKDKFKNRKGGFSQRVL